MKIKTNEGFLAFLINKYIPEKLTEASEDMVEYIMNEVKDLTFDFKEIYRKRRAREISGFGFQNLSSEDLVKKILNDKVENKIQYTRPLLSRRVKLMLSNESIDSSQKPEEIYQKITNDIVKSIKKDEVELPILRGQVKKDFEDRIQTNKFFRHLFGREKSYIIKMIKQHIGKK